MSRWFRIYDDVLNDPKAQKLSDSAFRGWVNLMCLASKYDGMLEQPIENVAFSLRKSLPKTRELLQTLQSVGLLDIVENGWKPHNWDARQFKSDVSTGRVKQFRKRFKIVSETPPDTDTDTEQNIKKKAAPPARLFVLPDFIPGPAWDDFMEMRRKNRKPATEKAKALLASSLEKLMIGGDDPAEILNQSTLNGWTDIYPLKHKGNGHAKRPTAHENFAIGAYLAAEAADRKQEN